jgi:small-conductance mechanosensitive channel
VVRTLARADIVIPNPPLVTEKITNWIHRDQLRRVDLPVDAIYGSARKEAIDVLEKFARVTQKFCETRLRRPSS